MRVETSAAASAFRIKATNSVVACNPGINGGVTFIDNPAIFALSDAPESLLYIDICWWSLKSKQWMPLQV